MSDDCAYFDVGGVRAGGRRVCLRLVSALRDSATIGARVVCAQFDVASAYKVAKYLTRLETRIAEFSVAASQWVPNPKAQ